MNTELLLRKADYDEVYWIKYCSWPFWPARLARKEEVPENVLKSLQADKRGKNFILIYFFGSHEFSWVEPRSKTYRFKLAMSPPGIVPKFATNDAHLELQYKEALYEARAYHEIPKEEREEIDGSDGEARSDMEDESSGGKETITEVDTVSDDEEGVAKKKKNRSKEMQHRQATRRRIVESDTDDLKRSSGESQQLQQSIRTPRKKQTRSTRKKRVKNNKIAQLNDDSEVRKSEDPIVGSEGEEQSKPKKKRVARSNSRNNINNNYESRAKEEEREDQHSSEEVERPKKKRRAPVRIADDSNGEGEEENKRQQHINSNDPGLQKRAEDKEKGGKGTKKKGSATALVSIPDPSQESKKQHTSEEEEENESKEQKEAFVASPPLQTTPLPSDAEHDALQHGTRDFEDTFDSQELADDDPPFNSPSATQHKNETSITNNTNSTSSKNSSSSKNSTSSRNSINSINSIISTNSSVSLNSNSSNRKSTNNINHTPTTKYLITSDDEFDNNNQILLQQLDQTTETDKRIIQRSHSEGITNLHKEIYKHHSDDQIQQNYVSDDYDSSRLQSNFSKNYTHQIGTTEHPKATSHFQINSNKANSYQIGTDDVTSTPQINLSKNKPYYNNQSNILNPLIQKHQIPVHDDASYLNSQYPPPYNKNNSFYQYNHDNYKDDEYSENGNNYYQSKTNKNNNNDPQNNTNKEIKENKQKSVTFIPTQTYHNSSETPGNIPTRNCHNNSTQGSTIKSSLYDLDHADVADSQATSCKPARHIDLQNSNFISESNISTLAAESGASQGDKSNQDKADDITPTMRVYHTVSQCQPVPPSQLATPSGGAMASSSNFNFYSSPVLGVMDYYEQSKKRKKKENSVDDNNNNNNKERQMQDVVASMIAKQMSGLETALKQDFEQQYSSAIEDLKQDNAQLRIQIGKLNEELLVTRAEFIAFSKDIEAKADKKKHMVGILHQQMESHESKIKAMRDTLFDMLL